MKKIKYNGVKKIYLAVILIFSAVYSSKAEEYSVVSFSKADSEDIIDKNAFIADYIKVKEALVNDNFEQSKKAALELEKRIRDISIKGENFHLLKELTKKLAGAENLKEQRKFFALLSNELYALVKKNKLNDQTFYWKNCPMAIGGEGAQWLSLEEQVRNPYMGQRMVNCGAIQEKL